MRWPEQPGSVLADEGGVAVGMVAAGVDCATAQRVCYSDCMGLGYVTSKKGHQGM